MSLSVLFTNNKGELRQIKIFRIYLQAISMTGICNFNVTRITQQAYDGTFFQRDTNIRWLNQHRPTKGEWLVWRQFPGSFSDGNRYILRLLGKWNDIVVLHHDHEWFIW
jgi:hypothetical protein